MGMFRRGGQDPNKACIEPLNDKERYTSAEETGHGMAVDGYERKARAPRVAGMSGETKREDVATSIEEMNVVYKDLNYDDDF